jgi:hypothetical protein
MGRAGQYVLAKEKSPAGQATIIPAFKVMCSLATTVQYIKRREFFCDFPMQKVRIIHRLHTTIQQHACMAWMCAACTKASNLSCSCLRVRASVRIRACARRPSSRLLSCPTNSTTGKLFAANYDRWRTRICGCIY